MHFSNVLFSKESENNNHFSRRKLFFFPVQHWWNSNFNFSYVFHVNRVFHTCIHDTVPVDSWNMLIDLDIDIKTIDAWRFTTTWEAGWRTVLPIISTVPYEQQKIYTQIILFQRIYYFSISLTGLPCHREPSMVLMSMIKIIFLGKSEENELCNVRCDWLLSLRVRVEETKQKGPIFWTNFVKHKSIFKKVNYFLIIKVLFSYLIHPNNEW